MQREITVSEIMTREVMGLLEEQNLAQAIAVFQRFVFHHLPVIDERKVVGMLSDRDVIRATVAGVDTSAVAQNREARFIERTFVRDLMKTNVFTANAHDTVRQASSRMLEASVDCLPVTDEAGEMIGIVTSHDIMRMVRDGQ